MNPRSTTTPLSLPDTVQSVVHTQRNGPLVAAAAQLWIKDDDLVLDMTYGRGRFWTHYRPAHLTTNDQDPDTDADHHEDFRELPFPHAAFDVIVFDPPYIAQGGRESSTKRDFLDRYGLVNVPKTDRELFALVRSGISEAQRVLRPEGRLLVKCMDYINGGRYVQGRHIVVSHAIAVDLEQVDEFVHYSGTGPQPPRDRQLHSRRAHSFLCVFQKGKA